MRYRMVVCDLDDTLIDSEGSGESVSQFTLSTIKEYMERGGIFTVSTGRSMGSLLKKVALLGLEGRDVPLMSLNGTYVINGLTGEVMRDLYIPFELAFRVALECEARGLNFHLYDSELAYVTDINGSSKPYLDYTKSPSKEVRSISEFLREERPQCMKMLIMDQPEVLENVAKELEVMFPELAFLSSNKYLIEIIKKESGKGNALKFAADFYNIPISSVMAIGDSMNDFSMIEAAGFGVAMGNACKELKAIADYVTESCVNDGAALAIKKFCF